ncbi:MAG: HlyD family efflux transporter periplasmic adaptor subunit [Burkholderiaceae bacterium]|nr:HlyD family efflux transporter periplasmic adaptor subunit [Rhodoferax sp.]MCP5286217.1 HlyD family efflux transporter periplasmic adaptor subunit [Burkholderiaceae bacterium]
MNPRAFLGRQRDAVALQPGDAAYVGAWRAAQIVEPPSRAVWALWLMLAIFVAAVTWAATSHVDMIARADARVVSDRPEQVIASLEGGILREVLVNEGELVTVGQPLARLDPTRIQAQEQEGQVRRLALRASIVRLQAEATGTTPIFPAELRRDAAAQVADERASHTARRLALDEAVAALRRSLALVERELQMSTEMAAQGLLSQVEVMRGQRQRNELALQIDERRNAFRQQAAAELARLRTELAQLDEQMVVREDMVRRAVLTSPVRGIVKRVRLNTPGGVVAPGAAVMEIVPLGERVLVEMRIKPADIPFVKVGQPVRVKLSAYEYLVYGALQGKVEVIGPDALGDPDRAQAPGGTYYRALVHADPSSMTSARGVNVIPGMTGTAEVSTGERTVLSFIVRPLMRARDAFEER